MKSTRATPRTMGTMAVANPLSDANSPSRNQMVATQLSQVVTPLKPEPPLIMTGHEMDAANYTFGTMCDVDMIVEAVIQKYPQSLAGSVAEFNPKTVVIYRFTQQPNKFGVLFLDVYQNQTERVHETFSFKYKLTEAGKRLSVGVCYDAGTFLTRTPSVNEEGIYSNTINANVAYMSMNEAIEDGILASESFMQRAAPLATGERQVNIGKQYYPLLIYPDKNNPGKLKPFPGVGDRIRDDGVVFALRRYTPNLDALGMSRKSLEVIDFATDKVIMGKPGAMVYDVDVDYGFHNREFHDFIPEGAEDYIRAHAEANQTFYKEILKVYAGLIKHTPNYEITPELSNLIVRAMGDRPAHPYLLSRPPVSKKTHIGKNHRMVPLDKWKVTVKYVYHFSLLPGAKISNFHGNKGVVVRVAPDHEMPVDDFGNRADLIFPPNSPISRLNSGQLIEQYINAISRGVRNDMLQMMAQGDVEGAWQHYIQYIQLVSDYHYQHIDPENTEERDEILERIKKEPLVVILPAGTGKFDMDRATRLLQFRAPDISPVTYIDEQGKTVRTKSPVLIAPERIMTLDKSEHKPMATAGVTRQIHGFPAVENDSTKYTKPTTEKTTRVLGEGEVRAVAAVTKEGIRYTMALTNSPKGHKEVCRNIFNADNPLQIDEVLPHSETYGNRAVELIRHIGQCAGFDIEYKKLEE